MLSTLARRARRVTALISRPIYCRLHRLQKIAPSYFIRPMLDRTSIVIDCGLGNDASFSGAIVSRYGAQCHGVDPTRKHQAALSAVAAKHGGRLRLYPFALAATTGSLTFYEPIDQVSGSLFNDHVNATRAISYTVPAMTLKDLMSHIGVASVDVLKLDIEGAEYGVLANTSEDLLAGIGQMIVEFHHHCLKVCTVSDTQRAVARLSALGYQSYSEDGINYLFFRS